MVKCQGGGDAEDIYQSDFQEEEPAQWQQLIVAKPRGSKAGPEEKEKQEHNPGEENKKRDQSKKTNGRTSRNSWKMPAPEEKGYDNGGPSDHGGILAEEEESELHRAVFSMITAD